MKNNIFGEEYSLYKKIVSRRVLYCILSVLFVLILNLLFLFIRNEIGKTLSFVINVLLDILFLTFVTLYYDFKVSKDVFILKLCKQKPHTFSGMIEEITTTPIMYNKLECITVIINNKKYYSPVGSKIEFVLHKPVVVSVVKEIILEVEYE